MHTQGFQVRSGRGGQGITLETSDKTALDQLDKLADQQAKVTGEVNGDSIAVLSVAGGH
jgi:hypothetical protein